MIYRYGKLKATASITFDSKDAEGIIAAIDMAENEGTWSHSAEKLKYILRELIK